MLNLQNRNTIIVLSIFWGLGLACLFRKSCKGRSCIIYNTPPLEFIKENIFRSADKCYKYKSRIVDCKGKSPISN